MSGGEGAKRKQSASGILMLLQIADVLVIPATSLMAAFLHLFTLPICAPGADDEDDSIGKQQVQTTPLVCVRAQI